MYALRSQTAYREIALSSILIVIQRRQMRDAYVRARVVKSIVIDRSVVQVEIGKDGVALYADQYHHAAQLEHTIHADQPLRDIDGARVRTTTRARAMYIASNSPWHGSVIRNCVSNTLINRGKQSGKCPSERDQKDSLYLEVIKYYPKSNKISRSKEKIYALYANMKNLLNNSFNDIRI